MKTTKLSIVLLQHCFVHSNKYWNTWSSFVEDLCSLTLSHCPGQFHVYWSQDLSVLSDCCIQLCISSTNKAFQRTASMCHKILNKIRNKRCIATSQIVLHGPLLNPQNALQILQTDWTICHFCFTCHWRKYVHLHLIPKTLAVWKPYIKIK